LALQVRTHTQWRTIGLLLGYNNRIGLTCPRAEKDLELFMTAITKEQAIRRITESVPHLSADDLVEVYNDIFWDARATNDEVKRNTESVRRRVEEHMHNGLEVEEILDLWRVIFPADRNVSYDDETDTLHFSEQEEESGPLQFVD
jgi:chromatin segregation and condensation protein Rec8/ScpA/Scc1 (kleisin family)